MKLSYLDNKQRHIVDAIVTTDHAASSYGQPVVVLSSDNQALDITSWVLLNYQIEEATSEEFELLKRILIDPRFAGATLGAITSEKKATAARQNGKLGGRPRKEK